MILPVKSSWDIWQKSIHRDGFLFFEIAKHSSFYLENGI
jgi:hypothetical protein